MLKLKELRLSGIGRFVDRQTIRFDSLGNIVQVDAQNMNTGGSSGSGKTTLFNALDYLFGINDTPTTILQSRLTKTGIDVSGSFDWDGKAVELHRSKKGLKVQIDGIETEGSNKLAEEKIDEILGMPRDLFRKILHKRQKEGGFFLQLTPKETHEFLTSCISLGDMQKKTKILDEKITELDKIIISVGKEAEAKKSALKATQESILTLGLAPIKDIHQPVIIELKAKMEKSEAAYAAEESNMRALNDSLAKERQELEVLHRNKVQEVESNLEILQKDQKVEMDMLLAQRPLVTVQQFDRSEIEKYTKEAENLKNKANSIKNAELERQNTIRSKISEKILLENDLNYKIKEGERAKAEAIAVAAELKKVREHVCPTCEQHWQQTSNKEAELLAKVNVLKVAVVAGINAAEDIKHVQADMLELSKMAQPVPLPELSVIDQSLAALAKLIAELEEKSSKFTAEQNAKNQEILAEFTKKQSELTEKHQIDAGKFTARIKFLREQTFFKEKTELASKHKELSDKKQLDLTQARGQLDVDRRAFEAAVNKLKAYEEARVRYETSLSQMKTLEANYSAESDKLSKELEAAQNEAMLAFEAKKAINSYISCSFDEALEIIGENATRIIRAIPNMANATIQLEGTKETAAGKVKEEVNAVISMDGEIGVPIKSLSGGERSSVDLAVDLAVIDLIESKANKGIDLFILDEPFTGLDTVSIEMALEVLKNSNINKKLIIVDHNPEVKEMVESRLVVVRDGQTSSVMQG